MILIQLMQLMQSECSMLIYIFDININTMCKDLKGLRLSTKYIYIYIKLQNIYNCILTTAVCVVCYVQQHASLSSSSSSLLSKLWGGCVAQTEWDKINKTNLLQSFWNNLGDVIIYPWFIYNYHIHNNASATWV